MVVEQVRKIPGVQFHHGYDVTADLLNAMQQYLATEVVERTKDFIEYPGFAYGFNIGAVSGQSVTVTEGVALDQEGRRLYHPTAAGYKISFPAASVNVTSGYLCVRAYAKDVRYKSHPYDGTRLPVETALGLEFFMDTAICTNSSGKIYPSSNNGLILCQLTINSVTYGIDQTESKRSPFVKLKDGA